MKVSSRIKLKFKECGIYGGSYCSERQLIFIPERIGSKIYIYSLKEDNFLGSVLLPENTSPEVTILTQIGNLIIASRNSHIIYSLNKNLKLDVLAEYPGLFATSFSMSSDGKILVGNCKGPPLLIDGKQLIPLDSISDHSYDSIWISSDAFIMSFPHHNCIRHYTITSQKSVCLIKEIKIIQPYKFSKRYDNSIYLTTRGWNDRPGKLYRLRITNDIGQIPDLDIDYEFSVTPQKLLLQRVLPERLLKIFGVIKYKGYLNDVQWLNKQILAITLRNGRGIYIHNTENQSGHYLYIKNSIPCRFIEGSNYDDRIFFIDDGNKEVVELESDRNHDSWHN